MYSRPSRVGARLAQVVLVATTWVALLGVVQNVGAEEEPPLPRSPDEALRLEASLALPITSFYDAPKTLRTSEPGSLLRREAATEYSLPTGASAMRILYHSKDAGGADVAASAVVLIPGGNAPGPGWPVIVFAHGTSGVARACAPSAMHDLQYGTTGLFGFLKAGFAVISPDYHGLGTQSPHQYINKTAQAHDVIYAVPAAREAAPALGSRWVVDGHSQGGLAAWGVAEEEAELKDPNYLGAVAVAAATLHDGWLAAHPDTTKDAGFYLAWLAYGIHARFPEFQPSEMLTRVGNAHYKDITTRGCWFYADVLYRGVDAPDMLTPNWSRNVWVQKFFAENRAGADPIQGPLFAIAGESDTAVPLDAVHDVVGRACRNKQQIYFRSYPGLDHDRSMTESVAAQIDWIRDRFAGKSAQSNCSD